MSLTAKVNLSRKNNPGAPEQYLWQHKRFKELFQASSFLYLGIRVVAYKGACDRKIVIGHFVDDYADRRFRTSMVSQRASDFRHHGALLFQSAALLMFTTTMGMFFISCMI